MFYEFKHSLSADYFLVEKGENFDYPAHMHHCFEFLSVLDGEMCVEVDDLQYTLGVGDALLIFPNQIHSMHTPTESRHILCLFSPKLVNAYTEKTSAQIPVDNLFRPDKFYIDKLAGFTEKRGIFETKGLLYSLCGCFDEHAVLRESVVGSNILLYDIFKFIEHNFNSECTLAALARSTGYDYSYLSRYFRQTVGISYSEYVIQYKISRACYLLQNSEATILDISSDCGFNSLRSFNRNFRLQLGIPPAEYRRRFRGAKSGGAETDIMNIADSTTAAETVERMRGES